MKESIGVLSLTNIVIVFILLFTGYLCISLNQSKAYNVKNQIVSIIQKNNGINDQTITDIQNYMSEVGYRSTGKCDAIDEDESSLIAIDQYGQTGNNKGMICITRHDIYKKLWRDEDHTRQIPKTVYYEVKVFFALDMPVVNTVFNFNLKGSTRMIYCPKELGDCDEEV